MEVNTYADFRNVLQSGFSSEYRFVAKITKYKEITKFRHNLFIVVTSTARRNRVSELFYKKVCIFDRCG